MIKLQHLDKLGSRISFLCALHCAAQPLLLIALPMIGLGFIMDESFEKVVIYTSVALAATSLSLGYKQHKKSGLFLGLTIGIILIALSRFVEGGYEQLLSVLGALSLTGCHIYNQHYIHHTTTECPHNHDHGV